MKKIALFFTVAIIAAAAALYAARPCNGPECYLRRHLTEYKNETVYQNTDRLYGALLKQKDTRLRADTWTNIDQNEAASTIRNHIIRMDTLYEKSVSPYPGEVSNAISCDRQYRPKYSTEKNNGRETHVFVGYASERLVFGACSDDIITKRAAAVMFYCDSQKRLYKFELFFPVKNSIEEFNKETNRLKTMPCE